VVLYKVNFFVIGTSKINCFCMNFCSSFYQHGPETPFPVFWLQAVHT
jgi:hypothetical protein